MMRIPRHEAVEVGVELQKEHFIHHAAYSSTFEDRMLFFQFQELGDIKRKNCPPKVDMDFPGLTTL
jgi:hypothetical protein